MYVSVFVCVCMCMLVYVLVCVCMCVCVFVYAFVFACVCNPIAFKVFYSSYMNQISILSNQPEHRGLDIGLYMKYHNNGIILLKQKLNRI